MAGTKFLECCWKMSGLMAQSLMQIQLVTLLSQMMRILPTAFRPPQLHLAGSSKGHCSTSAGSSTCSWTTALMGLRRPGLAKLCLTSLTSLT